MRKIVLGLVLATAAATPALAVGDPINDFLATYTGAHDPGLDIVGAGASFDGTSFTLDAITKGPIGVPGSLYAFGINRGAGTARLALGSPPIGGSVLWDAVAILFPSGTARVVTFPSAGAPTITTLPGILTVTGNSISGSFAASLLPSTGFASPADYSFTLWSRLRVNPIADGTNAEVADFAPIGRAFAAVPEPSGWAMMLAGVGAVGGGLRHRRKVAARPFCAGYRNFREWRVAICAVWFLANISGRNCHGNQN
jgi:hypothetical protein